MAILQTRVYLSDTNDMIQELCKDGTGDWFMGSLKNLDLQAAHDISISAHINFASKQFKVYF